MKHMRYEVFDEDGALRHIVLTLAEAQTCAEPGGRIVRETREDVPVKRKRKRGGE